MSGHSKWSKIKRAKGKEDQRRGAIFSKLVQDIVVAVKKGGSGDANQNPSLAQIINQAKKVNMPKANIDRAIAKALSSGGKGGGDEFVLEGYGLKGVAILVRVKTDNKQRITAEIKSTFASHQGNLGAPGSAQYMFKSGVKIPLSGKDAEDFQVFINALEDHDDVIKVEHTADLV